MALLQSHQAVVCVSSIGSRKVRSKEATARRRNARSVSALGPESRPI